jgi:hypothetical protein
LSKVIFCADFAFLWPQQTFNLAHRSSRRHAQGFMQVNPAVDDGFDAHN